MEIATASNRMYGFIVLYDMHTDFFHRAIDGIPDDDAHNRLGTKANHIAWITGSLMHQRYELAHELGIDLKHGAEELFKQGKGIQDDLRYPTLAKYKEDWVKISPLLRDAFLKVTDQKLDEPFPMPEMKMSNFELISFMIYREANCIGQLALWRRLLGHPALNYM
jgi:hypothetical protein